MHSKTFAVTKGEYVYIKAIFNPIFYKITPNYKENIFMTDKNVIEKEKKIKTKCCSYYLII